MPRRLRWLPLLCLLGACSADLDADPDEEEEEPPAQTPRPTVMARDAAPPPPGPSPTAPPPAGRDAGPTPPPDAAGAEVAARLDAPAGGADAGVARDAPPAEVARPDVAPGQATANLRFFPDRRTFTDTLEVRLEADHPGATIHYTTDDRPPTKASPTYAGPIRLTRSTIIRAFVSSPEVGDGPVHNEGFVKLAPDAAGFSSDIPVFLVWSYRSRPQRKADGVKQAVLLVFEPDPTTRRATLTSVPTLVSRIGINVRGSSSEGFPKKQYKVELWGGATDDDQDRPLLGLPAESDWIINAGYPFDRAYIRNAFVYAVSNRIGRYAPRTRFAEVLFTGSGLDTTLSADYMGLYTLIEKIKISKNRLPLAKLRATDVAEPAVTGGYVFKIDRGNAGETGFRAGGGPGGVWFQTCPSGRGICGIMQPLVYDDPEEMTLVSQQKAYLPRVVDTFANALGNRQDVSGLIDVASFIDHHIVNLLPKNPDAFRLSGFFHKDRGGKINAGPVWDFDRTINCAGDGRAANPTFWDPTNITNDTTNFFQYGWYRGLFDDASFRNAYFQRLRALLGNEMSVARLHALVDELIAGLGREAPARDAAKWPGVAPRGSFAEEVRIIKDWLRRRVEWMQGCLSLPDPRTCTGQ